MKKLHWLQTIVLLIGTLFAWVTVYGDFARFYAVEGTVFKVSDCLLPNPVTTPCFWGAWAFLAAVVWSVYLVRQSSPQRELHQRRLSWLLLGGTLFAWGNFSYELVKFLGRGGEPGIGCSGQLVTNPLLTACFVGATLFLAALVVALVIRQREPLSA